MQHYKEGTWKKSIHKDRHLAGKQHPEKAERCHSNSLSHVYLLFQSHCCGTPTWRRHTAEMRLGWWEPCWQATQHGWRAEWRCSSQRIEAEDGTERHSWWESNTGKLCFTVWSLWQDYVATSLLVSWDSRKWRVCNLKPHNTQLPCQSAE